MPPARLAIESDVFRLDWPEAGIVGAILRSFGDGRDSPDLLRLGGLGRRISEASGPLGEAMDAAIAGERAEPIELGRIEAEAILAALAAARTRGAERKELARLRVALESLRGRSLAPLGSLPFGEAPLRPRSYDF